MNHLLVASLLGLAAIAGSRKPTVAATALPDVPFSITVTSTPTGWAAKCDAGCHWTKVSFDCRSTCGAIVDANGLRTLQAPRTEPSPFAFRLDRTDSGFTAVAEQGTAWGSLSWYCRSETCTGRIDASGVGASVRHVSSVSGGEISDPVI
jgi:hypothetical protein